MSAFDALVVKVYDTADWLESQGVDVSDAIKRRDKREPGRRRKEEAEEKLYNVIRKLWKEQEKQIRAWLEANYSDRKAALPNFNLANDDAILNLLVILLRNALQDGIWLFGEQTNLTIDYTLANAQAIEAALGYGFDLVNGINETTMQALKKAIATFAETPGMTIGDVMDMLPFTEQRAQLIATTEITRAYSRGNELAGQEMQKQFPSVNVIKRWYTNEDDKVCVICGPLTDQVVKINEMFVHPITGDTYTNPPAHPGCRCWNSTSTALGS